ncbi:MAG: hypothetical protein ACRC6T_05325 [Sarcina sp.]
MENNKYRIDFLDENNLEKSCIIYDYRKENKNIVIIESENHINPTDYTEVIHDILKLKNDIFVILDLTDMYGMSEDSLYQWVFIEEDNELVDEMFIPINKIDWLNYKDINKCFKEYILKKTRKFNNMIAV